MCLQCQKLAEVLSDSPTEFASSVRHSKLKYAVSVVTTADYQSANSC